MLYAGAVCAGVPSAALFAAVFYFASIAISAASSEDDDARIFNTIALGEDSEILAALHLTFTQACTIAGAIIGMGGGMLWGVHRSSVKYAIFDPNNEVLKAKMTRKDAEATTMHAEGNGLVSGDGSFWWTPFLSRWEVFTQAPCFRFVYDFYYFGAMVGLLSYITVAKWDSCSEGDSVCLNEHRRDYGRRNYMDVYKTLLPAEFACICMMAIYAYDEGRHLQQEGWDLWIKSQWNRIDGCMIAFFILAYFARFANEPTWARVVLSVTCWICWFRMLNITEVTCKLGPMWEATNAMLYDVGNFILVLLVILIGYGIATQGLLNPEGSKMDGSLLFTILFRPYFQMYGELYLDDYYADEHQCPSNSIPWRWDTFEAIPGKEICFTRQVAIVLLVVYLMLSSIVLVNLLVAMMSDKWSEVANEALVIYKRKHFYWVQ
jgi:hypothetical protein